ncbi:formate dehydrogenase subunit delta [Luteimonas aquatica]|uniref:formate dehydrogenase subunit delta n=1 Tax=Luteimonas aquatica TaxID=450364 RepID=UPI001F58DC22|nr:formate dehydrogenase subunit delta [Luteimonas aquatica]
MNPTRLAAMANDIARYFDAEPDRAAALDGMVLHLQRFWEPRMRLRIVQYLREEHGAELSAFAREAVSELARRAGHADAGTPRR